MINNLVPAFGYHTFYKTFRELFTRLSVVLLMLSPLINTSSFTQEKVVFHEEIYWEWPIPKWYGGNSFYWWHRSKENVKVIDFGEMSSKSWSTPVNYKEGTFYMRVEVLDQPTKTPFRIQMGIWQDYGLKPHQRETVSEKFNMAGGAGSVIEVSLGKPSGWWVHPSAPEPKAVDFSRPGDFYRIGIVLWTAKTCIPMSWTSSVACSDYKVQQANFFPMRARVTIVACGPGTAFSGWANYRGPSPTNIEAKGGPSFTLFPNITHGSITVNTPDSFTGKLIVIDMTGQLVESVQLSPGHGQHVIDLSHLRKGIYFVRIEQGKALAVQKVVMQ